MVFIQGDKDVILIPQQPGLSAMVALVGRLAPLTQMVGLQILSWGATIFSVTFPKKAKFDIDL